MVTDFGEHVRRALDSLPPDLARGLQNVAIVIEEENLDEPELFGLYQSGDYGPHTVTIYRRPLEAEFHDPFELEREIRITVLHELGHYFGLDEDRLAELGYE
jgi:predicted Zn-dependent protease with MMP-like domain